MSQSAGLVRHIGKALSPQRRAMKPDERLAVQLSKASFTKAPT